MSSERRLIVSVDVDNYPGSEEGIHYLLDQFSRLNITGSFLLTAGFSEANEDLVAEIVTKDHEIGVHGRNHGLDWDENYLNNPIEKQRSNVSYAKCRIEEIAGLKVNLFRAPYLLVGNELSSILLEEGFEIDSSIPSLRFDFGFGNVNQFNSFRFRPGSRFVSNTDIFRSSVGGLLEIPPSAFMLPYSMTTMRMFPTWVMGLVDSLIHGFFDPGVFICHPWEFCDPQSVDFGKDMPRRHRKNTAGRGRELLKSFLEVYVQEKGTVCTSFNAVKRSIGVRETFHGKKP